MAEYLYKAYLSYSHTDEDWARWLHRALESYRVPSALIGQRPDGRVVPDRLSPVFRDREDLSSAANLSDGLQQALQGSESLILICSPAAAASRWVNEEVRYFQALGRADRVFCMVVDGQPDDPGNADFCFPPALFDGVDDAPAEPLAADPRPYADGKALARLKLIAGLLGVRLDELRRRELKRKRRWQAMAALALVAAVTLVALAVTARLAEQRERQNAEQMATFIVDLGEDLKSEIDLESLSLISSKAMSYLQDLDPGQLSPETAIKVGLALRQIGQVSEGQGRSEDAQQAYYQSREVFADLNQRFPERDDLLFELGQAEFYVAAYYFYSGQHDLAFPRAQRYAEISRQLYQSDPENPAWRFELSYATTGLLAMRVGAGDDHDEGLLREADEALMLAWQIMQDMPDDPEAISNYSSTLAWVADTRVLACELNQALEERKETLLMADKVLQKQPSDNQNRESYAYAHSGVASVAAQLGEHTLAQQHWRLAIDALDKLWREDPSNERLRVELQWRRLYLVEELVNVIRQEPSQLLEGNHAQARALLKAVEQDLPDIGLSESESIEPSLKLKYLAVKASLAAVMGETVMFRRLLEKAIGRSDALGPVSEWTMEDRDSMTAVYFMWWEAFNAVPESGVSLPLGASVGLRYCKEAWINTRLALIDGNQQRAREELSYLNNKAYKGDGVPQICEKYDLCQP